jgi:hypothetical protein
MSLGFLDEEVEFTISSPAQGEQMSHVHALW